MPAPALFIYPQGNSASKLKVWPLGDAVLPVGTIQENTAYVFELAGLEDANTAELFVDDERLEPLRATQAGTARWNWGPGFYAGSVEIEIEFHFQERERFELITDPNQRKLTRDEFSLMVSEILDDTLALFTLSSFRIGVGRGGGATPPLVRLEYLRSRIDEIEAAVSRINARPVRVLRSQDEWVPSHNVHSFTGGEFSRSLAGSRAARVGEPEVAQRLPAVLNGVFPTEIRKRNRSNGLDIKEHQEIKAALKAWAVMMEGYASSLVRSIDSTLADEQQQSLARTWSKRCWALARRLWRMRNLPVFTDVSDRPGLPLISSIYRRLPDYQRFFTLYQDMNLGIANIFGDFLQLPLARTFDLYELWCFFRLLRVLASRWGKTVLDPLFGDYSPETGSLKLPSKGEVIISLSGTLFFSYQRRYKEYWKEDNSTGSFSHPMEPDLSFEFASDQGEMRVLVFDSKYRIDQQLNDAITSIHTYRDAIVQAADGNGTNRVVVGAYLLSPHLPVIPQNGQWKDATMPGRLFYREYREQFKFGAATLKPGMTLDAIADVLDRILADTGVTLA